MPRVTDPSIHERAPAPSTPPAWRRLLPLAAVAALVAAMIVRGLARHDANVRTVRVLPNRGLEMVRGFVHDALRFVERGQQDDGSWAYGRGATPGLETLDPAPRAAATARILLAARAAGYDARPMFGRGLSFVRAHQERLGRWLASGAREPQDRTEGTIGALATGVLLLGPEAAAPEEARRRLQSRRGPAGLYPRRLDAAAPPAGDIPVADNVALLAALPALGLDTAPLLSALRRQFDEGRVEPAAAMLARYLASLAGPPDGPLLRWLLVPGPVLPAPAAEIDNLALAAHLKVRADECLRGQDTCQDLNAVVAVLVQRRHSDGSWTPAPYERTAGYTGSAFETTAVAMSGLAAYRRVLEGRATGGLLSGEEKEALEESLSPRRK
jgi:hypothetical protein